MKKPSDPAGKKNDLREKIIGLGERSLRKSYYPQLREQIRALEKSKARLEEKSSELSDTLAALRRSEERFRSLYENAVEGIFQTTPGGRILSASPSLAGILGYESSEELIAAVTDAAEPLFVLPEHQASFWKTLRREGEISGFETKFRKKDGERIWVSISARLIRGEKDNRPCYQGVVVDITKRKQMEAALRDAYDIIRRSPAVAFLWQNAEGWPVEFVSDNVEKIFGYSAEDFISGRVGYTRIIYPEDRARVSGEVAFHSAGKGIESFSHEPYRIIAKNGETRWLEDMTFIRRDEAGEITHYQGIVLDISGRIRAEAERKKLETRLRQAQKMEAIGTLAGGIAHDFNNILSVIVGCTELALLDISEESSAGHNLSMVLTAGNRAKDLVHQILTFSRQRESEKKPMRLDIIVNESCKMLRASLPSAITIRKNIECHQANVIADPTQMHRVLMNLCTNAAHAMGPDGGLLEVGLEAVEISAEDAWQFPGMRHGPYVKLTVSDTGPGMDRSISERIFDPYFTTKAAGEGTGLGLSVVHGIVKGHGGTIRVYSEVGKGTSFHILLPGIGSPATSPKNNAVSELPKGDERILVIDDEEALLKTTKQMLKYLGYEVVTRISGAEALEIIRSEPGRFDLIITDMIMPEMTGAELGRKLKRIRPELPMILCTGFSELITEDVARDIGFREFLRKPILIRDLAEKTRKALDS